MSGALAVTGLTGKKSGGAFAKILSEDLLQITKRYEGIRALVRETSDKEKIARLLPDATIMEGSLEDPLYLEQALSGVDTVLHIASISLSYKIAEVAAKVGVRRLVFVHTTGIYSKYKAAGEGYRRIEEGIYKICKEKGILLTVLRPTMIYGNVFDNNVVKFIKMADKLKIVPMVRGGRFALQPVHYEDLAKAYYSVLYHEEKSAGKDYILSGGTVIDLRDVFVEIGNCLGKKIKFFSVPFWFAYGGAVLLFALSFGKKDYREKVQRLCEPRAFPHKEASDDLGYAPISFKEGIAREVEEYLESKTHR